MYKKLFIMKFNFFVGIIVNIIFVYIYFYIYWGFIFYFLKNDSLWIKLNLILFIIKSVICNKE